MSATDGEIAIDGEKFKLYAPNADSIIEDYSIGSLTTFYLNSQDEIVGRGGN